MTGIDKDAFIATVVHDMRAPLNACLMSLSLVELKASEPAEVLRSVEVIRRNLERQAALINDLGDALQIVGTGLRLEPENVDLGEILDAASEGVQLPDGVALDRSKTEGAAITADRERLARALEALIESVAAGAGAGDTVVTSVEVRDGRARIAVRLSAGGGSNGESGPAKRPAMRLSVAREIVARHGGQLSAEGGSGSIDLPLAPEG